MTISNNLNSMTQTMQDFSDNAVKISNAFEPIDVNNESELNADVSDELINAIVDQIPQQISYEANAQAISVQNEVMDSLINITA